MDISDGHHALHDTVIHVPPAVSTVPQDKKSLEIPRIFEEVRQSIDFTIEQRKAVEQGLPKPSLPKKLKKTVKKVKNVNIEEHKIPVNQLCGIYGIAFEGTKLLGLSQTVAEEKLKTYGKNILKPPKGTPVIIKFIKEYTGLFSILLYLAGVLSLLSLIIDQSSIAMTIILSLILWGVAIFNGTISFIENMKSEKAIKGFNKMSSPATVVFRDGKATQIDASNIVIGDVVKITAGDKVPCDIRMVEVSSLKTDNSSLTGESEPIAVSSEMTHENPLESRNLCFFGTLAVEGEGIGIAIRTGNNTVIGQVANLASSTGKTETPLRREINQVVYIIALIAILMSVGFFIYGVTVVPFLYALIYAIGTVVANIPQGLIATVTLMLSLGARRLAKKNLVVKNLEAVEILGSTSVICSDKTGTITQNRMTVVNVWTDNKLIPVAYEGGKSEDMSTGFIEVLNNSCLCSRTVYEGSHDNLELPVLKRKCLGDASETALLRFYDTRKNFLPSEELREKFPKKFEIPFNSKNKWQISIHAEKDVLSNRVLRMKGAPERIFGLCTTIFIDGKEVPITDEHKSSFDKAYKLMASKGQRVLGHAVKILDFAQFPPSFDSSYNEENVPKSELCFLGLTGLMDPPKLGVPEAVAICKTAGVQVVMVTGDHPLTAKAIAKQVGIIEGDTAEDIADREGCSAEEVPPEMADAVVVEGGRIDTLSKSEWDRVLAMKQVVFARTSPQQKLLIVSKFQEKGHVVSVTGDGVNDSPALKKADLGIAMNLSGSDVSKEAASMVLMDDNFSSIVEGVKQGRLIYENIKKSIAYTVTHAMPEVIPFLLFFIIKIPLPLSAILILFIDLGTELVNAISLVYEPQEKDIMLRKPRSKEESMFDWSLFSFSYLQIGVIETLGCLFAYFMTFLHYGIPPYLLYGSASQFFIPEAPPIRVPNGSIYTAAQQMVILQEAQTVYFITLAFLQNVNLFNCKARRNSLLQQGIFSNPWCIFGVVYATVVAILIGYVPIANWLLLSAPPQGYHLWVSWIPFGVFIFVYDEVRKFYARNTDVGQYLPYAW